MQEAVILNDQQIRDKIKRMAFQILESCTETEKIILAGIADGGYSLAKLITVELNQISDIEVLLCEVLIDKKNPKTPIKTNLKPQAYEHQFVVLVDDVLNSGTTLIYGVRHFLEVEVRQFKTAVLVDRSHKKYPVKSDFKGISLSTSIQETVEVNLSQAPFTALLK
jgi:pyrimidine operon attenuation protein/uracil phosphoribosyltransferase